MRMSKLVKREHLFGISPCLASISAGRRKIYKIWLNEKISEEGSKRAALTQIIEKADNMGIAVKYKPRTVLDRISRNKPHQNVVMETGRLNFKPFDKDQLLVSSRLDKKDFLFALDQIHDPMNFGAIIRSAYYFGVDKIIVGNRNSCGLTPTVSKASAGAMEWAQVYGVDSMEKFLKQSVKLNWDVIGTSKPSGSHRDVVYTCDSLKINKPCILVLGNEGFGLSSSIADICTKMVTIPPGNDTLPHDVDSLNVSVAAGILLHSLLKCWR
ncbi:rRNA methyltransferase 1, mitochondrial-like isoform X2 [Hydractinia symbiolongicarpus]|uniref:rRNA methyltransferase 1, mitochondrial-like isoform X2 n=1 Tax=Hydractinia symbiolongicarpus TaxID=13093 RepID=UPI00254D1789|nr:rRNA methyltransferase 1, mitochondrial-like isoform X2 [Hydractinia symbiolongicarpus]